MFLIKALFFISSFLIFWPMLGYPYSMKFIGIIYKSKKTKKDYSHQPTVTVMVVAHNEEKVILEKLYNLMNIEYPKDKIQFLISSDNSTDKTNEIVENFISEYPEMKISLYKTKKRMGKTNAQNEAQKMISSEYLVMTDANSMIDNKAIKELMATFTSKEIAYVTGRLSIKNQGTSEVSNAEANYWNSDIAIREIEGRVQTITAGNGALYACRNSDYYDFEPIKSHDSSMPVYYALEGKRAVANHDAIAYEKAGENIEDEFKRKVRMNRVLLQQILPDIRILNVFKYKWFTYFYFGHRTCRYLLWLSHLLLFLSSALLLKESEIYVLIFFGQLFFYLLALLKILLKSDNKILTMIYYYTITNFAQWIGVYNILTGKAKPFWEKAESTR